ncbi:MAG: hypothetical protein HYW25_04390 [Candidatus Aenigmarchaeota archaeon]|nr:hypothetical protein [Candidatus Aenigmarchaeota archaeon]
MEAKEELREGIVVRASILNYGDNAGTVLLYIDGQKKPFHYRHCHLFDGGAPIGQWVDIAYHEYLDRGNFSRIESDDIRAVLEEHAREKRNRVPWHRRTYRFLPRDLRERHMHDRKQEWAITTDKSDIRETQASC